MKQVFYSEITNKYYDSKDECRKAELQYQLDKEAKEKKEAQLVEASTAVSKEKKELSNAIEAAEKKVAQAYQDYEIAKKSANELRTETEKKIQDILKPAKKAIEEAQEERYKSISEFNKKYGCYTTVYTGDRAFQELQRTINWANDIFKNFF